MQRLESKGLYSPDTGSWEIWRGYIFVHFYFFFDKLFVIFAKVNIHVQCVFGYSFYLSENS